KMLPILSAFQGQPRRRRAASHKLSCGQTVERCESMVLLSAAVATVPLASEVAPAATVAPAAKTPADFSGHHDLNGTLGPGSMDVTQNGSLVDLTISFDSEPDITNVPLSGKVKGSKLKATLASSPYNNLKKVVFKAKLNDGDLIWKISWRTV
ncbi:MAG: hypothetical protein KDA36_04200, partial [Planctomycetaceae bacterium]|nr:hypothetical protein [Planctomycetaceae bacterium]